MKQYDVVVITAHPDDAFIGAGGFLLKMRAQGLGILVITVTDGDSQIVSSSIRTEEFYSAIRLCDLDGYQMHFNDEDLQFDLKGLCHAIHEILHDTNPSLVVTHNCFDQHADHRAVSLAVKSAKDMLFHSLRESCRLKFVFFFQPIRINLSTLKNINPQVLCDISDYYNTKIKVISLHLSQKPYIDKNLNIHIALNRFFGSLLSCQYAEGYNVLRFCDDVSIDSLIDSL